jgi:N-hydroxyarylamine O-acetyltransferase
VIDVDSYLRRIGSEGVDEPDAVSLLALHRAHLLSVPFENLDIHLGRPIELSEESLHRKIVDARRGGFCYELNGLFAALLRELGFHVSMLSAGVMGAKGDFGPPFDHLALEVTDAGGSRWLADVGFGEGFMDPVPFEVGREDEQDTGTYRVDVDDGQYVLWRKPPEAEAFEAQYRFPPDAHVLADFEAMCHHHQTSPQSSFPRTRVCSLALPDGRVTLTDDTLIVTREGRRAEQPIEDDAAYRAALREHFGIVVSGEWLSPRPR